MVDAVDEKFAGSRVEIWWKKEPVLCRWLLSAGSSSSLQLLLFFGKVKVDQTNTCGLKVFYKWMC